MYIGKKQRDKMIGWFKASALWSTITGLLAFAVAILIAVQWIGPSAGLPNQLLFMASGVFAIFGAMQTVDGLIRLSYQTRLDVLIEDVLTEEGGGLMGEEDEGM